MTKLSDQQEIIELTPTIDDLRAGANYSAITLPWTFNRMMFNTGVKGQNTRAHNIAKGIVVQAILRRYLLAAGIDAEDEVKSHRANDLFDFRINRGDESLLLDVKSIHYYTDYAVEGREEFSPELLIANANYPGPDWRHFFPMLVPHTQIKQPKEAYCFAISSSHDFRHLGPQETEVEYIAAFPYGEALPFLTTKKLVAAREEVGKGFYIQINYHKGELLGADTLTARVVGEWDGELVEYPVDLVANANGAEVGPLSCFSNINLDRDQYEEFHGQIDVSVCRNDFGDAVLNSSRRDINAIPTENVSWIRDSFCNLCLPTDFRIYLVGWTVKEQFLENCRKYSGWVWPNDAENKFHNQSWSQMTESDTKALQRAGFEDCIGKKPSRVNAGWLKTHGHGGGACCYVFPNIGRFGGVKETNLFVLPQDLNTISSIDEFAK